MRLNESGPATFCLSLSPASRPSSSLSLPKEHPPLGACWRPACCPSSSSSELLSPSCSSKSSTALRSKGKRQHAWMAHHRWQHERAAPMMTTIGLTRHISQSREAPLSNQPEVFLVKVHTRTGSSGLVHSGHQRWILHSVPAAILLSRRHEVLESTCITQEAAGGHNMPSVPRAIPQLLTSVQPPKQMLVTYCGQGVQVAAEIQAPASQQGVTTGCASSLHQHQQMTRFSYRC